VPKDGSVHTADKIFEDQLWAQTLNADVEVGVRMLSGIQDGTVSAATKSQVISAAAAYSDEAKSLRDQLSFAYRAASQDYSQAESERERESIRAGRDRLVSQATEAAGRVKAINGMITAFVASPSDDSFKQLREAIATLSSQIDTPSAPQGLSSKTPSGSDIVNAAYPSGEGKGYQLQVTQCAWKGSEIVIKFDVIRTGKAETLRISGRSSVAIDDSGRLIPAVSAWIDGGTSGDNASRSHILLHTPIPAYVRFKPENRNVISLRQLKIRTTAGEIVINDVPVR